MHAYRPPASHGPYALQSHAQLIQCANCGGTGHVYRICNHPISSFGIICYRFDTVTGVPQYLLVQRKDSLCYVEFIRGKYMLENRCYIMRLLSNMTQQERDRIQAGSFDDLWYGFWQTDKTRTFMKEYEQSKARYTSLIAGYFLRQPASPGDEKGSTTFFDLATAIANTESNHQETEWGFPKGRRNINESDLRCACREFREETGVDVADVHVWGNVKPFDEVFTGINHTRYRHVYYLAQLKQRGGRNAILLPPDASQTREIRRAGWFDAEGVLQRIREENVERREMFKRVHQLVLQTVSSPSA
jgi:8-oxo-dGTP pyrophosphatase MutT (NUDIX family)